MFKFLRSVQFLIREFLSSYQFYLSLIAKARGYEKLLVNENTKVCIEGYPRSANTRASAIAMQFYKENEIARHTHSIGQLKKAIEKNVDVYFIVREPSAAIASNKIRNKNIYLRLLQWQYKRIYSFVNKHKNNIKIVNFECVVKDEFMSDLYNEKNIQYQKNRIDKKVEDMEIEDSGGVIRETHVARPSSERVNKAKPIIQAIKASRGYEELNELYEYSKL